MHRAMVVEGTPLLQDYRFAAGTPSFSDDEDDSPPLLSDVEQPTASASTTIMAAASVADAFAEILDSNDQILANERLRNRDYDSNMASLGGRLSRFEQIFSEVRDSIGTVRAESASLVVLNMNTCTVVGDSIKDFIRAMENTNKQNAVALADYERRIFDMTAVHTKSIGDMQAKLQGSFDRMKYLEKTFHNVPGLVTMHLEDRLPAILTDVVGKALAPTLTTVLTECLPHTLTDVLGFSLADFQSQFGTAGGADTTVQERKLLEAAADHHLSDHSAVMTAIEGIGARLSALDDVIASSDAFASSDASHPVNTPTHPPPPVATRPASSVHLPVPHDWGCNFQPSAPAPPPPAFSNAPSPLMVPGLRVDTAHAGEPGGRIKTPRSIDPARHARNMKTNRFDLAGLADTGYHIGDDGVALLNERIISNCGYQSFHADHPEDVLLCFQEIVNLHRLVVQTWTNTRTHFSGPVVEYIIEKALPVFPRLLDLDVSGTVKFYDGLQKISMRYLLPLMPFDSISLGFGYEGLCPPGLGTTRYSAIASAWMDVLPRLLPLRVSEVESAIFSVGVDSNNGFDLMWRILELAVPGFKSMNPVQVPAWNSETDVLSFCRAHLLYFRLQAKHNMFFSARTQTNMFLRNIQPSEYADVVTTLQSQVNAYLAEDDDGYLPANLCINGIATAIYMNASARVRDVGLASPRVRRVAGDWDSNPVFDDELPLCGVQGYCPRVYRVEQGQDRFRRPYDREGPAGRGGRGFDRDMAGRGRGDVARDSWRPSPRDRSIRPDLRRRTFLPGVQCAACKRLGHEASTCDMLAIALFLDKYKKTLPDDSRRTIESTWVARFKERLGQPQRSPTQVMKAYCEDLDITAGHLDLAMDWDCWPEDEYGAFTQDLHINQD